MVKTEAGRHRKYARLTPMRIPTEQEILDICKSGEDQLYEFKSPGIKMEDLSEEIAAFLHTKQGGIIFYGIDDDGTIIGSDMKRQILDQRLQNSVRNTIDPAPDIQIKDRDVLRSKIIVIIINPWDRKNLYQFKPKLRYMIRKGTNKFALQPEEIKKLSRGVHVA